MEEPETDAAWKPWARSLTAGLVIVLVVGFFLAIATVVVVAYSILKFFH